MQLRRAGEDVIDLGFGNPDLPSPAVAVEKLAEAVRNPRNHRYSMSKGLPKLRLAVTDLYEREFGVTLDFETEVCATIGAKEGFSHMMLTLVGPATPRSCRARRTPSTSGAPSSPAPRSITYASVPTKTSSPTCKSRGNRRGRDRVWLSCRSRTTRRPRAS